MKLDRIGPYTLVHRLGAGGMAEAFAAVRRGPGGFEQWVCIKRILPGQDDDPSQIELFLDEARLLAQLRNANIVQVYDFGEAADGSYYMVLELVDGLDLSALLRDMARAGTRMSHALALYVLGELLRGLHYAHHVVLDGTTLGVVHRDVSPSNVLVARHGEVKLTDFGIATYAGRRHRTRTGFVRGKVAYMSPEQLRGDRTDNRTDLFAAGIVGFELLAGVHPFEGGNEVTVLTNIYTGKRPRLEELVPDVPPAVVTLIDGLLETEHAKRTATAAEALAQIAPFTAPFAHQHELAQLVQRFAPKRDLRAPKELGELDTRTPAAGASVAPPPVREAWAETPSQVRSTGPQAPARSYGRWLGAGGVAALLLGGAAFALRGTHEPRAQSGVSSVPKPPEPPRAPASSAPPHAQAALDEAAVDAGDALVDAAQASADDARSDTSADTPPSAGALAADGGTPSAARSGAPAAGKRRGKRTNTGAAHEVDADGVPTRSGASVHSGDF